MESILKKVAGLLLGCQLKDEELFCCGYDAEQVNVRSASTNSVCRCLGLG